MSVSMSIDMDQLKLLIRQCKLEEKVELFDLLEKETFAVRFRQFVDKIKADDLTLDEISAEVETVRQRRYDERKSD